ncbi:serine hydrolase domain-containing protein [Paenibacillus tepidiphilus]|uniref:serine hydrolase domain-containing protein n=1 Tax=Paenibacillus tepidiphilus TaxID=2608683 RepID=UPI00123862CE|nr:serine hydrolase domain-containing protein [Paenibacillus tepidiphilus]
MNASLQDFDTKCLGLMRKYRIPGASVALVSEGQTVFVRCYGYRNRKKYQAVLPDTLFQAGSIAKSLTAWGVMRLHDRGLLDIDAPVIAYLPDLRVKSSQYEFNKVTVRQLLNHTSGLMREDYYGISMPSNAFQEAVFLNPRATGNLTLNNEPGTSFIYTGGGYTLLQRLVEQLTREPFHQYMQAEILFPLGMRDSSFVRSQAVQEKVSVPYGIWGNSLRHRSYEESAAAGLYTTIKDLAAFLEMNCSGNNEAGEEVVSRESIQAMHSRVQRDIPYGLGYYIYTITNSTKIVMHDGINIGGVSRFMLLPKKQSGMAVLTNSNNGFGFVNEVTMDWLESIVGTITDFYREKLGLSRTLPFVLKHLAGSFINSLKY